MSIKDQLETDINAFFQNIEKQTTEDKKKTLILLMDKYIHLFSSPVLLDKYDFEMVKSHAHKFIVDRTFPKFVGPKRSEISSTEANVLAIIEGTIMVLNNKECLRKMPKFDYRD
jgi:hypothetical protein